MKQKKKDAISLIDEVQKVRAKNNKLWMDLLRISMMCDPIGTRKILAGINKNDKKISELVGKIK